MSTFLSQGVTLAFDDMSPPGGADRTIVVRETATAVDEAQP